MFLKVNGTSSGNNFNSPGFNSGFYFAFEDLRRLYRHRNGEFVRRADFVFLVQAASKTDGD